MLPVEVKQYINENFYKIKKNKFHKYYSYDHGEIKISEIKKNIEDRFENFTISTVTLLKSVKLKEENNIEIPKKDISNKYDLSEFKVLE
jgi:transcription-repair coupling factor (superfamily II helicase)